MFNGCAGWTRNDFTDFQETNGPTANLDNTALTILHLAGLAPSGHNSQPWRVRIESPDNWIIEAERHWDGLSTEGMEIRGLKGWFVRQFVQPHDFLEEKSGIEQIAGFHDCGFFLQFVLRVGYLNAYPEPVSLRRPVKWLVTPSMN